MARRLIRTNSVIEEPTVNLTPLIDVVFVILIMFIVIAPLLELDKIELAPSSPHAKNTGSVQESSPIAIHVHANNEIYFKNRRVTLQELSVLLNQARKEHPQAVPQIFHDKKAQFGTYQSVKNTLEEAGFEKMDIVLKP